MKFREFYLLRESIHDKNLLKAIFIVGGPGSGKSFISSLMFEGLPVKFVNSDIFFEKLLKKYNLPLTMNVSDEIFEKQRNIREKAKELVSTTQINYINGMLPLVIDGTGKDYQNIKEKKDLLESFGYDAYLVFINTNIETAKKRNLKRERNVPTEFVEEFHKKVQGNIGKFQHLFKNNFYVIDNNEELTIDQKRNLELSLYRKAMKFLNEPIKNNIGKQTIKRMKETGKSYQWDLNPST